MLLNFLAYAVARGVNCQRCHMSHFTRKELAERTGYSERTICRIAGEIPGATPRRTGRWTYPDRVNPDALAWIQRARIANDGKRQKQQIRVKRQRKKSPPSMVSYLQGIQACAAAFDSCMPFLHKIHLHPTGSVDFDETLDFDEWLLFLKLVKSLYDLPPPDRIELLLHYFQGSTLPTGFRVCLKWDNGCEMADQLEARYAKAKAHVEKLTQSILAKAFRGE